MDLHTYVQAHSSEYTELLFALAQIPGWTGGEQARAEFCLRWLKDLGYANAYIDAAGSVICSYQLQPGSRNTAFAGHLDTVFSSEDSFTIRQTDGRWYCPGIGDNSANAVGVMLLAKYCMQEQPKLNHGVWFVLDTGEEGLGNLVGVRTFMRDHGSELSSFTALDLYYSDIFSTCVGSIRYRVKATVEGGHSYLNFGRKNALAEIASLVTELYSGCFERPQLTYNVGSIRGGGSVNTIAAEAEMLSEFRSVSSEAMRQADIDFRALVESRSVEGCRMEMEVLGLRPCGENLNEALVQRLAQAAHSAITASELPEPKLGSASTDCNIPLSLGIPAICFGVCSGGGAHTRGEWIEAGSNLPGMEALLRYFTALFVMELQEDI